MVMLLEKLWTSISCTAERRVESRMVNQLSVRGRASVDLANVTYSTAEA